MRFRLIFVVVVMGLASAMYLSAAKKPLRPSTLSPMERKLRHIESNGSLTHPDPTPTEFTEAEVNAYFAAGKVEVPAGVQSVSFQSEPGVITGNTRVDFDQIRSGAGSFNPLLEIFSGVHDVVVVAHAHAKDGQGYVHVDSVSIDGVNVPRFALQMFVEKYIQKQYPQIGLDSQFALTDRIDSATLGLHKLTVIQK